MLKPIIALLFSTLILITTPSNAASMADFDLLLPHPTLDQSDRTISLIGEIDINVARKTIDALKDLDASGNGEITIIITSPGGSVYDGLGIIDQMAATKSPIKTVCEGSCMSMAAVILASGTNGHRFSMPHATIMVHTVATQIEGHLNVVKNDIAEAQRLQDIVTSLLATDTGLDEKTLTTLMDHDNYMPPQTAKSYHLIDRVVGE